MYLSRTRVVLQSKLNGRYKCKVINMGAVDLMRYGVEIIYWKKYELHEEDWRTCKPMAINKKLHIESVLSRLYIK